MEVPSVHQAAQFSFLVGLIFGAIALTLVVFALTVALVFEHTDDLQIFLAW